MSTAETTPVVLPPVLYWSQVLAEALNRLVGEDAMHGLIDASVSTVMLCWSSERSSWTALSELPPDARRLVCEHPAAEVETVWGVRWPEYDEQGGKVDREAERYARQIVAAHPGRAVLVRHEVHRGPWVVAS